MSAQETAEAIFIVIKRLAKWLLFLIIGLIVLGLIWWGIYESWDYYSNGRHKKKVSVIARFDNNACPSEQYPLFILIGNASSKKVTEVTFEVEVTRSGRSTKINDYQSFLATKFWRLMKESRIATRYIVKDMTPI